jgi:hypothetical protein
MVYTFFSVFSWVVDTKLLPSPGGPATQATNSCFPLSLTVMGHKTIFQIGALKTEKTTFMYRWGAVQAEDRVQA